jgi:hypothetical protein
MIKLFFMIPIAVFFCLPGLLHSSHVKGFVFKSDSVSAIENAAIVIVENGKTTYSDNKGFYDLNVPAGEIAIRVECIGYESKEFKIIIEKDSTWRQNVYLSPVIYPYEPIIITGTPLSSSVMNTTLSAKSISSLPALAEADIFRAVQILPGISSVSDFSGQLFVRGSPSSQTLITYDGAPVFNPYHLGGYFSMFNSDGVDQIEFYPALSPVDNDSRLAGQLNITPKFSTGDNYNTRLAISLLSSRLAHGGSLGNLDYFIAGRRFYFDLLDKIMEDNEPSGYYFYDLQSGMRFRPDVQNTISLHAFFSQDAFTNLTENDEKSNRDKLEQPNWGNRVFSLKWNHCPEQDKYIETQLAYSKSQMLANTWHIDIKNIISEVTFKSSYFFDHQNHSMQTGFELKNQEYKYNWAIHGAEQLENLISKPQEVFFDGAPRDFRLTKTGWTGGVFFQDMVKLSDIFKLTGGIRVSRTSISNSTMPEPRLNFTWLTWDQAEISCTFARLTQTIYTLKEHLNEEFFSPFSVYFPVTGKNRYLWSNYYALGINRKHSFWGDIKAEVYMKDMHNLPSYDYYTKNLLSNRGKAYGLDVFYQKVYQSAELYASYALSVSRLTNRYESYLASHERRHNVKFAGGYNLGRNWKVNVFWIYQSGLPYTPLIGVFYGAGDGENDFGGFDINNPDQIFGGNDFVRGNKNIRRYPYYQRLDVGFSKDWIFKSSMLSLKLQILNLYNKSNAAFYDWNLDYQDRKKETVKNLPIIPSLEFEYKW